MAGGGARAAPGGDRPQTRRSGRLTRKRPVRAARFPSRGAFGEHYLLALTDNWPTLAEVRLFFAREPARTVGLSETVEGEHGRIEPRRARVCHQIGWLTTNRRFPGEPRFPDLAMIGMIGAEVERDGRVSLSHRSHLGSAPLCARDFARAARGHRGVENRLHWVMDVIFHHDLMRLRTENGRAKMATVRHAALNLVRAIPDEASLKVRRKNRRLG